MTAEQQRIAISEWIGYYESMSGSDPYEDGLCWFTPEGKFPAILPNYPIDLNAINDAEKNLSEEQKWKYVVKLSSLTDGAGICASTTFATAQQRSEALCRTLWPESFQ